MCCRKHEHVCKILAIPRPGLFSLSMTAAGPHARLFGPCLPRGREGGLDMNLSHRHRDRDRDRDRDRHGHRRRYSTDTDAYTHVHMYV